MHMNSAPHLLTEDRPEFERVLDEALRTADHDPELAALGGRLNTEQLRTMALGAVAAITACAAAEYRTYVQARDELHQGDDRSAAVGIATAMSEAAEAGAGAGAVLAVLAPVLAGIAALLFLVIGYVLRTVSSDASVADSMITIGWWFGGLTAAGILVAMGAMLLTALRNNGPAGREGRAVGKQAEAVAQARDAWRQALLHRGVLPFLREALATAGPPAPRPTYVPRNSGGHRTPHLGYSRPGFSSPEADNEHAARPRFSSPDFTSPDYGGPDHRPE
ncbi:membrane protein [Streptomyces varsoviensis]|uniref:Membrane protein n=1 Tax=Streptomyces varsoviensis TaxID=67373 RepID=A0ABR5ISE7_9ACTN|nr:membrane protein [Streptomyces varsoviensis]